MTSLLYLYVLICIYPYITTQKCAWFKLYSVISYF